MNLDKITARFGRAYTRQKTAERWLKLSQKKLFEALDEDLHPRTLAQQTVKYSGNARDTLKRINQWITKYYPGWELHSKEFNEYGCYLILKENPSKMTHSYVNDELGMVFGRSRVESQPSLDDERLKAQDPELWRRISHWPEESVALVLCVCVRWTTGSVKWSDAALRAMTEEILEEAGVERVLNDPSTLAVDDLALLQAYLIPGPVSVRLTPPRKAREDEL